MTFEPALGEEFKLKVVPKKKKKNRQIQSQFIVRYTTKIFFRVTIFLHSLCPSLEGIKDALFYKLTTGQNCSAVCTNEVART